MTTQVIAGSRTQLRPLARSDWRLIYRWLNTPEVMRYWGGLEDTLSQDDAAGWVEEYLSPEGTTYALIIEAAGRPIGFIEISRERESLNYRHRSEIDICIGEPAEWELGYGSDALVALMRHLFVREDIRRIFLQPRVNNPRAIHVYEKVGFVREGIIREAEYQDGEYHDAVMMAALRDEWLEKFGRT